MPSFKITVKNHDPAAKLSPTFTCILTADNVHDAMSKITHHYSQELHTHPDYIEIVNVTTL